MPPGQAVSVGISPDIPGLPQEFLAPLPTMSPHHPHLHPPNAQGQSLPSSRTPSAPRQHRGQGASTLPVDSSLQGGGPPPRSLPELSQWGRWQPLATQTGPGPSVSPAGPGAPVCLISPSAGMLCGRVASSIFQGEMSLLCGWGRLVDCLHVCPQDLAHNGFQIAL